MDHPLSKIILPTIFNKLLPVYIFPKVSSAIFLFHCDSYCERWLHHPILCGWCTLVGVQMKLCLSIFSHLEIYHVIVPNIIIVIIWRPFYDHHEHDHHHHHCHCCDVCNSQNGERVGRCLSMFSHFTI